MSPKLCIKQEQSTENSVPLGIHVEEEEEFMPTYSDIDYHAHIEQAKYVALHYSDITFYRILMPIPEEQNEPNHTAHVWVFHRCGQDL